MCGSVFSYTLMQENNNSKTDYHRLVKSFVVIAFLGVLLSVAFRKMPIDYQTFSRVPLSYIAVSFLIYLLWQVSIVYRWYYCLNKVSVSRKKRLLMTLIKIIFIGNLVSISLIPSFIGQDSVKLLKWKEIDNRFKPVVQSLLITRVSGFLGVLFCGVLCIIVLFHCDTGFVNINLARFELYNSNTIIFFISAISILLFLLFVSIFFREKLRFFCKRTSLNKIKENLELLRTTLKNIDWAIISLGIIAQILFVFSTTLILLSVNDIKPLIAITVIGISALGRMLPLSFLGITAGEGIQCVMLMKLGWGATEITLAIGISVAFFYATAILGFFMETYHQLISLKSTT